MRILRFIAFGLAGLLVAWVIGELLGLAGAIQADFLMYTRGGWLVVLLLLGGPVIGLLLAAGKRSLGLVLAGVVLVIALTAAVDALAERRAMRESDRRVNALREEAQLAATTDFGPGVVDAFAYWPGETCKEVLVWVSDGAEERWYWYSGAQKRLLGSLTEERLRPLLLPFLPPGSRITDIRKGVNTHIAFDYTSDDEKKLGLMEFSEGCLFRLESLSLVGSGTPSGWKQVPLIP